MAFEQKKNQGALFSNNKRQNENSPNLTGKIDVEGREFWISGWTKVSKDGKKYLSLAVNACDKSAPKPPPKPAPKGAEFKDDDINDIPW